MELTGTNSSIGLIVLQSNPCNKHGSTSDTDVFCTILFPTGASRKGKSDILFADLVALPGVPHPIPFRTRSLSPPGPMVLRLKARESRSPPGPPKGYQHPLSTSGEVDPGSPPGSAENKQVHKPCITITNTLTRGGAAR